MSDAKHTPGEWTAGEPATHSGSINICAESGEPVAMVPPGYGYPDREATARLIAAAPELHAACELIVAVKHCMMFMQIHDPQSACEVLAKHGAANVQILAKIAQDAAEAAIAKAVPA